MATRLSWLQSSHWPLTPQSAARKAKRFRPPELRCIARALSCGSITGRCCRPLDRRAFGIVSTNAARMKRVYLYLTPVFGLRPCRIPVLEEVVIPRRQQVLL